MPEYISREAAIARLNENRKRANTGSIVEACYSAAIDSIYLIPAADVVEVRHGHWYLDNGCAFCSECKNSFIPKIRSQAMFCPRCGAKMDGGQDE